jgi:fumarate reductase subunit D
MPSTKKTSTTDKLTKEVRKVLEDNSGRGQEKKLAALSYIFILCLIPLLGNKDSAYIQHHAKQGFVLFVLDVLVGMVSWFPVFGQLAMLVLLIVSIMGVIKALNNERWEIPFVYDWSKKINF